MTVLGYVFKTVPTTNEEEILVRCYWHLEDGNLVHADIPECVLRITLS